MIERMSSTVDRLEIFKGSSKGANNSKIKTFVGSVQSKKNQIETSVERLRSQQSMVQTAVSNSSSSKGLDPQMEPLVTSFVEGVEDIYNNISDQITAVKEFEKELKESADIGKLLVNTEKTIKAVPAAGLDASAKDNLSQAQRLLDLAKSAHKNGNKEKAFSLSSDAYYMVMENVSLSSEATELAIQYTDLIKEIDNTEVMLLDIVEEDAVKPRKILQISQKHAKNVKTHLDTQNLRMAQKELNLSNMLVAKAVQNVLKRAKEIEAANHGHEH